MAEWWRARPSVPGAMSGLPTVFGRSKSPAAASAVEAERRHALLRLAAARSRDALAANAAAYAASGRRPPAATGIAPLRQRPSRHGFGSSLAQLKRSARGR